MLKKSTGVNLSLEDRLLVALAARGNQRIGQFLVNAVGNFDWPEADLFYLSDEDLVVAVEEEVFGDDEGLHRAERDEHPAHDGASPAGTEAVE